MAALYAPDRHVIIILSDHARRGLIDFEAAEEINHAAASGDQILIAAVCERARKSGLLAALLQQQATVTEPPLHQSGIVVDEKKCQVRYDGKCCNVTADGALMMKMLVDSYETSHGGYVTMNDKFGKPSEVRRSLQAALGNVMPELAARIRSNNHGYQLSDVPSEPHPNGRPKNS